MSETKPKRLSEDLTQLANTMARIGRSAYGAALGVAAKHIEERLPALIALEQRAEQAEAQAARQEARAARQSALLDHADGLLTDAVLTLPTGVDTISGRIKALAAERDELRGKLGEALKEPVLDDARGHPWEDKFARADGLKGARFVIAARRARLLP